MGDDNELCAYKYIDSWSGEEECDLWCGLNSGVLGPNGECHYENMEG